MVTPDSPQKLVAQAILIPKENRMERKFPMLEGTMYEITCFENELKICTNLAQSTRYAFSVLLKVYTKRTVWTVRPVVQTIQQPVCLSAGILKSERYSKTSVDNYRKCTHKWYSSNLIVGLCLKHKSWDHSVLTFFLLCTKDNLTTI